MRRVPRERRRARATLCRRPPTRRATNDASASGAGGRRGRTAPRPPETACARTGSRLPCPRPPSGPSGP
eukprot:5986564-Pyramimonas_sp.AAC.1